MKKENNNIGRVYLGLRGDDFDPHEVSAVIGIEATQGRRKGAEPRRGLSLPKISSWDYSTEKVQGIVDVYEMGSALVRELTPHIDGIIRAIKKFHLEATFQVILTVTPDESVSTPAIGFDRDVLEFIHKIGGTIDIDTYRGSIEES
jgi:uncharacterized protein DUF4279